MSTLNTAFDAFRQRIAPEPPAPTQPSYADLVKEETAARPLITEQGQLDYENMVRRTFGVNAYAKQMDEMEQELERLRQQRLRFIGRFKPSDTGLFRVSGSELNDPNSLFFDDAGNVERGYMNYREFTNAANIYGNTIEFLGESTSTKFEKTKNATSNALLMSSNAGKSLSKYLSMDNIPEDKKKEIKDALASRSFFGKMFSGEWDLKDLPIVSSIASLQDNVDTNLLQWEDKTFEPSLLVDIIEQEDPEFAGFLKSSGVDFEQLRVSKNIFDFRYQINTAVQSNAIAKSMDNYNRTAGALEKSTRFAWDQLVYSIDSPDFGGQILIALGTATAGNLIAGGATIASRVGATSLTASKQAAKMATTINRIEKAGAALKNVKDYLPVNLGETLATKAFGPSFGKNKFVSWLAGPMVTEFFEEAAIDLVNQSINIHYTGTQLEYDWNQVLASGAMGGAMAPALSGLFRGGSTLASFPVKWIGQGVNWALNKGIVKIFNINPGRVKEFRAYAKAFYGKDYDKMTAEQKKTVLHAEIMAIAAEQELNNMTNNQFGRMEDPENAEFLTMVKALSKIDMANSDTNNTNTLDSVIAASQWLDSINARVVTDPKTGTTSLYIQPQVDANPDIFIQDKETGRVSLTKETLKEFVIVSSLARTTDPTNAVELVAEFMKERIKRKLQKENIKAGMEPEEAMEAAETEIVNGSERVAKETEFIGKLNNVVAPLVTNDAPAKQTETAIESKVVKDIAMDADREISETVNAIVAESKEAKPKTEPVAAQVEPVAAQAEPVAAPTAAPAIPAIMVTPTATTPATMDMARALETLQAHPELISLISKICK
jgi:hypothetical protein